MLKVAQFGAAEMLGDGGRPKQITLGSVVSCGRVGLFPRQQSSLQQGAEYLVELLWQSCIKPKLHTRPAPYTDYKSLRHNIPAEQFTVYLE